MGLEAGVALRIGGLLLLFWYLCTLDVHVVHMHNSRDQKEEQLCEIHFWI